MKNFSNLSLKNVLRSVAFTALVAFLFVPSTVLATDTKPLPLAEIKYIGSIDFKPVFQIDFNNEDAAEVNLLLRDENGTIIYFEVIKDKKYSRKIQLENIERNARVTLKLRSKKGSQSQVFQINKSTRIVEDVVIAKVQ